MAAHGDPPVCQAGGAGAFCRNSAECLDNKLATVCVNAACAIPCEDASGNRQPTLCSLGETCVPGESEALPVWYCKASAFAMDLNLLDSCIGHFVEGPRPDLTSANVCSLENNLNRMLDQDGNGVFNIFDVEGCLRAFLNQEPCASGVCQGDGVFCGTADGGSDDVSCGRGLFCNVTLQRCERECGLVGSREDQGASVLERKCTRPLTVCDYNRGRCVPQATLAAAGCQVDGDCPVGAVCSLGVCEAKCQRSTDCQDSRWYCGTSNRCMPRPTEAASAGFVFEPQGYAVRLGAKSVVLTPVQSEVKIPLIVMDVISKKQVFNNPAVVFGYRLEAKYGLKQDQKCQAIPIADANQADCHGGEKHPFITLGNPFGVVGTQGSPGLEVALDRVAADKLTPGLYQVTVSIFLSNGGQDSFSVEYRKSSPSGLYSGELSIFSGGASNLLGKTNVAMRLFVDRTTPTTWDAMLTSQNLESDGDVIDITQGYLVTGYIDGNDSMVFDQPKGHNKTENRVPVRGLYSPQFGRMRVIATVDIPADFCRSDTGDCSKSPTANEVRVTNPFGRPIRRVMHFMGPFDERAFQFHGIYREILHGIAPETMTLEGDFTLSQWKGDESPVCDVGTGSGDGGVPCATAPLYASKPAKVEFPDDPGIQVAAEADVARYCVGDGGMVELAASVKSTQSFRSYLDSLCVGGSDGVCDHYSSGRMMNGMVRLDSALQEAVNSLNGDAGSASLSLNDYLRGRVVLCSDNPESKGGCINENEALCGIALHRRALLSGAFRLTVDPRYPASDVSGAPIADVLFCGEGDRKAAGDSCRLDPRLYPTTVALQEHNRFYKQLTQATRYEAANELSDAMFAMYRAANSQLERAQVMGYKQTKLQSALRRFNGMEMELFSPVSTSLMFKWPMRQYGDQGKLWLKDLHSVLADRLQVMRSLIDLRRRVLASNTVATSSFVQHLMHMEYLSQAYLMFLQKGWEGDGFKYEGQGPVALEVGQAVVNRVSGDRNPLGLHPQQIFFENANLATSNWKNYRAQILPSPQGSGLLADVRESVKGAVANLKESLKDEAAFMGQIQATRQQFDETINSLCGSADSAPPSVAACEQKTEGEKVLAMKCDGPDCLAQYNCQDSNCSTISKVFEAAAGTNLKGTACDLGLSSEDVPDGNGGVRVCSRGQMGDALRQRQQLHLQRQQVVMKTNALVRQVAQRAAYIEQTEGQNGELLRYVRDTSAKVQWFDAGIRTANAVFEIADVISSGVACGGFDCIGKGLRASVMAVASGVRDIAVSGLETAKEKALAEKEIQMYKFQQEAELRKERMALDDMTTAVENLAAEYQMVSSSLFGVDAKIADIRFLASEAARRRAENTGTIIQHLVGGMNGDVLQRNKLVLQADAQFDALLLSTYKLAMAFIHSYNLKAQSEAVTNRVFQLMTPDDVAEFLADLDRYEGNYCGGAGIDCDSVNNVQAFRFSVREQLFPGLRDVVDSRTGAVLTKGEQFHNIITSDAYLRTRERAGQLVKQIEIPFSVWLNDRGANGAYVQQWMVSPLECNHIVAAGASGTIAVNVIGTRLRNLTYELGRGNTDFIRGCESSQTVSRDGAVRTEYPINTFSVGYAPQNSLAQKDETPSYSTHSNGLLACKNVPELGGNVIANESCFKYFARERSLGAPDWSITVPFGVAYDNDWVFGPDKPIIEDIVIYIRYRTRPI